MKRFNGEEFISLEEERLYSTGSNELDEALERAFCEGYEFAQREFGKLDREFIAKMKNIKPSEVTREMLQKFRGKRKELMYDLASGNRYERPESINQVINRKVLGVSHGGGRHTPFGKRLREGTIEGASTGRTLIKDIGDYDYNHGAFRLPKDEGGNAAYIKWMHKK